MQFKKTDRDRILKMMNQFQNSGFRESLKAELYELCIDNFYFSEDTAFSFPEDAVVKMTYKNQKGISEPDIYFNPSDYMIPPECEENLSSLLNSFLCRYSAR